MVKEDRFGSLISGLNVSKSIKEFLEKVETVASSGNDTIKKAIWSSFL